MSGSSWSFVALWVVTTFNWFYFRSYLAVVGHIIGCNWSSLVVSLDIFCQRKDLVLREDSQGGQIQLG